MFENKPVNKKKHAFKEHNLFEKQHTIQFKITDNYSSLHLCNSLLHPTQ